MDHIECLRRIIWLDPCPEPVWQLLPGGPDSWSDRYCEVWQYMGTIPGHYRHEFRHRAHPLFDDRRVYAFVADDDAGPHLTRLIAGGREVPLEDLPPPLGVGEG
jgi:hypothetical protein